MIRTLIAVCLFITWESFSQAMRTEADAASLKDMTWLEAKKVLTDSTVVVIPLGAAAKEHGPHLLLKNDWLIAEYLRNRIAKLETVAIYPTISYNYYPAFLEYAGSTSLRLETASDVLVDLCRIISMHGPRKFYILNTGVSTLIPLKLASERLAAQGILMTYTDILNVAKETELKVKKQKAGTHADEIETSMMLYIAPQTVNMKKAVKDIPENDGPGPLTPYPNGDGRYSPTGIYGDATLASHHKGELIVEAMVRGIREEIQKLKAAAVPESSLNRDPSRFTGTFQIAPGDLVAITLENGNLYFQRNTEQKILLKHESPWSFYAGQTGRIVFFPDEKSGLIAYINLMGKEYLGRKKE